MKKIFLLLLLCVGAYYAYPYYENYANRNAGERIYSKLDLSNANDTNKNIGRVAADACYGQCKYLFRMPAKNCELFCLCYVNGLIHADMLEFALQDLAQTRVTPTKQACFEQYK